jgi:hypothetical protein
MDTVITQLSEEVKTLICCLSEGEGLRFLYRYGKTGCVGDRRANRESNSWGSPFEGGANIETKIMTLA